MEDSKSILQTDKDREIIDLCPKIISFQTELGSIYTKLPDGKFQRHKYDGSEYEPMEWTVFTDEEGEKHLQMARLRINMSKITKKIIFFMIAEFDDEGNSINLVSHPNEIIDINSKNGFDLITFESDGANEQNMVLQTAITFTPKIGYSVFEFSNGGEDYHHGHLVSNIESKDK